MFMRSMLSHGECGQDLFGVMSFEDSVQTLYAELQSFFTTVITTLCLCRHLIKTERAIREDGVRCAKIYKDCEQRALGGVRELTKFFCSDYFANLTDLDGPALLNRIMREMDDKGKP